MEYVFPYDDEMMAFGPVTVRARARLRFGDEPVKLKPRTEVEVGSESGYAEKVSITDSELIQNGTAQRFVVELQQAFTLKAYRELILGQKPLSLRVTLFPDMALPVPTAGVPIPDTSLPVAETVSIGVPKATIGRIEAVVDGDFAPDGRDFYVKARVHLPQIIADRPTLERQYTQECRFVSETDRLHVAGTEPTGEWMRAHLTLAPQQDLGRTEPEVVAIVVRAEIEGLVLEGRVQITVHPVRQLALVVSEPYVRTKLDQSVPLTVHAVDLLPDGSRVPADDADISILVQEGLADVVRVMPNRGQGELGTEIRQTSISKVPSGELLVQAQVEQGAAKGRLPLYVTSGKYVLTWRVLTPRDDAASDAPWSIYWDPAQRAWRCEPIKLKLSWGVEGRMEPRIIEDVGMEDLEEWLEIERLKNGREDGCVVYLRVKPSKVPDLVPAISNDSTIMAVDPLPEPRPPWKVLETQVTLSATEEGEVHAVASVEAPCTVEPPRIPWQVSQAETLRLSGEWEQVDVRIDSGSLPRGWDKGLEVLVAFADPDMAERMGLSLGKLTFGSSLADAPIEEISQGTVDIFQLTTDAELEGESPPARLRGVIEVHGQRLCLRSRRRVPVDPDPEYLNLSLVMRSPERGVTRAQQIPVRFQPQLTALYLGAYPYEQYPWHKAKYQLQVIREDHPSPTPWSTLPLSLRHLSGDGWSEPPVKWRFSKDQPGGESAKKMDDRFASAAGVESGYIAPNRATWVEADKPSQRAILCTIGPGTETEYVDEDTDPDLYLTALVPANLTLAEALPRIKVRVGVKPRGLPESADGLNLRDEGIYDALNRVFTMEVDLQKLPPDRRGE